ncbi:DUF378 domain-containing protein [Candidatus Woesearchaeota archaeon]|nr:DUF378 domain-containing protein [Candidatus Woesearchaeota archaeon]
MAGNATVDTVAKWLVVIGGLNWGLVGVGKFAGGANWDVVGMALGSVAGGILANVVYVLVGLAAAYTLLGMFKK